MLDLLEDVRIVSFNHFLMGPLGIQILADLGADVICVEPLEGGFQRRFGGAGSTVDGDGSSFHLAGRNKRTIAVNLKHRKGVAIALELSRRADVVAENFRPGVMERLGLGYETLARHNRQLVYAAATGFGSSGPGADRPGQDLLIQALSGLAMITGSRASGPRPVGVSVADHHGAALYALGILAALLRRRHTGKGCCVDVDLMSAAIDLQAESFVSYLNGGSTETLLSPEHIGGWYNSAPYGIYAARDGHLAISHCSLQVLAETLAIEELFPFVGSDLFANRDEVAGIIATRLRSLSREHILAALKERGVWCAPVNGYEEVVEDPQVRYNRNFIAAGSARGSALHLVNHPVRYDGAVAEVRLPPQPLGAQTVEILSDLGYDRAAIDELVKERVVGVDSAAGGAGERLSS